MSVFVCVRNKQNGTILFCNLPVITTFVRFTFRSVSELMTPKFSSITQYSLWHQKQVRKNGTCQLSSRHPIQKSAEVSGPTGSLEGYGISREVRSVRLVVVACDGVVLHESISRSCRCHCIYFCRPLFSPT